LVDFPVLIETIAKSIDFEQINFVNAIKKQSKLFNINAFIKKFFPYFDFIILIIFAYFFFNEPSEVLSINNSRIEK